MKSKLSALCVGAFALFMIPAPSALAEDERSSLEPLHEEAKLQVAEEHTINTLPAAGPHRIYVVEPIFPVFSRSKVWVIDGDKLKIIGMFGSGAAGNLAIAPDHSRLYYADTHWARGDRGERTDVVTAWDARNLKPTGEADSGKRPLSGGDQAQQHGYLARWPPYLFVQHVAFHLHQRGGDDRHVVQGRN